MTGAADTPTTAPRYDPRPLYLQIADDLRRQIRLGLVPAGGRLESMRELCKRYSVAPMTARTAVRVLQREGLVYSAQGRGTFVLGDAPRHPEPAAVAPTPGGLAEQIRDLASRLARLELMHPA